MQKSFTLQTCVSISQVLTDFVFLLLAGMSGSKIAVLDNSFSHPVRLIVARLMRAACLRLRSVSRVLSSDSSAQKMRADSALAPTTEQLALAFGLRFALNEAESVLVVVVAEDEPNNDTCRKKLCRQLALALSGGPSGAGVRQELLACWVTARHLTGATSA